MTSAEASGIYKSMNDAKANKVFQAALTHIESESIRAWAQTDHNKPFVLNYIKNLKNLKNPNPQDIATTLTIIAIGL